MEKKTTFFFLASLVFILTFFLIARMPGEKKTTEIPEVENQFNKESEKIKKLEEEVQRLLNEAENKESETLKKLNELESQMKVLEDRERENDTPNKVEILEKMEEQMQSNQEQLTLEQKKKSKVDEKKRELVCTKRDKTKMRNIIYIRTPKTSSSTLSGILRTNAYYNDLSIIWPMRPNSTECNVSYFISENCIKEFVENEEQFNMSVYHLYYNPIFKQVIPNPFIIFSTRHPYTRALSMYKHGQLMKKLGGNHFWNEYDDIETWSKNMGPNSMYGYLRGNISPDEIDFFFSQTSFTDSILLLRRALGFGIEEILYFTSKNLTETTKFDKDQIYDSIMERSSADYKLYLKGEEFLKDKSVLVPDFEEEKSAYLELLQEARDFCKEFQTKDYTKVVNGLQSDSNCLNYDEGCGYECFHSWSNMKKDQLLCDE